MMKSGTKQIFWGILIATFHLNLGGLTILPAFVGWSVVASGLSKLEEHAPESEFGRTRSKAYLLVGASLLGSLLSLYGASAYAFAIPLALYGAGVMVIELALFHHVLEAAVQRFQSLHQTQEAQLFTGKDRTYLLLMGVSLVLVILSITFQHAGASLMGALLAIATRIYLLTVISALGNTAPDNEAAEHIEVPGIGNE